MWPQAYPLWVVRSSPRIPCGVYCRFFPHRMYARCTLPRCDILVASFSDPQIPGKDSRFWSTDGRQLQRWLWRGNQRQSTNRDCLYMHLFFEPKTLAGSPVARCRSVEPIENISLFTTDPRSYEISGNYAISFSLSWKASVPSKQNLTLRCDERCQRQIHFSFSFLRPSTDISISTNFQGPFSLLEMHKTTERTVRVDWSGGEKLDSESASGVTPQATKSAEVGPLHQRLYGRHKHLRRRTTNFCCRQRIQETQPDIT